MRARADSSRAGSQPPLATVCRYTVIGGWHGAKISVPSNRSLEPSYQSYRVLKPSYRTQTYRTQGFGKFGFYEGFKVLYANLVGDEIAYQYRYTVGDTVGRYSSYSIPVVVDYCRIWYRVTIGLL